MSLYTIPIVQVRGRSAVIYNEYVNTKPKYTVTNTNEEQETTQSEKVTKLRSYQRYQGIVTQGAAKRIKKAVCLLLQSTEQRTVYNPVTQRQQAFKISFITLTIPQLDIVEAKYAHKNLLEPMLRWLRNTHKMNSYVWKAEQQKRGQLHYHITCDCFIHYMQLRQYWNKLLSKHNLNSAYVNRHGHDNANSTDVHSIKKVKNIEAYLCKYLSKSEQNDKPIDAKVWDCSKNLKKFKYFSTVADDYTMCSLLKAVDRKEARIKHEERYTMIFLEKGHVYSYLPAEKREEFRVYMWNVRNYDNNGTDLLDLNCTEKLTECIEKRTGTVVSRIQQPQQNQNLSAHRKNSLPAAKQLGLSGLL